jgi:hypothetical protein
MSTFGNKCWCGGLIIAVFVASVPSEACEHAAGCTACPPPRVEWNHNHTPEPEGPLMVRQTSVLGTGTAAALPPGQQLSASAPQRPEWPLSTVNECTSGMGLLGVINLAEVPG